MSTTGQAITHLCKHDIEAQKVYQFSCSINLCLHYVLGLREKNQTQSKHTRLTCSQNTPGSHTVKTHQAHTQSKHTRLTQSKHNRLTHSQNTTGSHAVKTHQAHTQLIHNRLTHSQNTPGSHTVKTQLAHTQ